MEGEQSQEKRRHLDGFSFGMKGIKGGSCVDSTLSFNPGVGSYEVDKGFKSITKNQSQMKFNGSQRFKTQKMVTPGPGSYNPEDSIQKRKELKIKIRKSSLNDSSKIHHSLHQSSTSNNLGPGYYYFSQMNDSFFNSTQMSAQQKSKGKQHLNMSKSQDQNISFSYQIRGLEFDKYSVRKFDHSFSKQSSNPPVGSYFLESPKQQESYSFAKGKRQSLVLNYTPGPGKYSLPNLLGQTSVTTNSNSNTSTQKRFFALQSFDNKAPGPGTYFEKATKEFKFNTNSSYSFGKQNKDSFQKNINPPPGHYRTYTEPVKHAAIIGTSKRPKPGNSIPGIGTYEVALTLLKQQKKMSKKADEKKESQSDAKNSNQQAPEGHKIDYKERLLQQKKLLLAHSPNFGKDMKLVLNNNISLHQIRQLDIPSPTYYSNLLQVVKRQPIQFLKGSRREEFLDVHNVKLLQERSPGPAQYNPQVAKSTIGASPFFSKKGELFNIISSPGVGRYEVNKNSTFSKYRKNSYQDAYYTKNTYKYSSLLPSLSKSGQPKYYIY